MIKTNGLRKGVTTAVFTSAVVVLIIVAAVGYGLYATKSTSGTQTTTTITETTTQVSATATITLTASGSGTASGNAGASNYQTVTGLAFSHWTAIGDANLSGTMSQYSSNAALWWYVHGSALNTTSGPYTGSAISSTWTKFFAAGPTYWTVYNYSLSFTSSSSASVTADVWYVIGSGNNTHTLYLPYELDYNYQNGQWTLTGDWWGLPHSPGYVYVGVMSPSSSASSGSTTSSSSSSTTTTSSYVGYGY